MLQPKSGTVHLTARFEAASAGKATLNLTGIRKAWLDGQPPATASEPSTSVELSAGAHTFTVELESKSPQLAYLAAGVTLMMPTSTNWPPFVW